MKPLAHMVTLVVCTCVASNAFARSHRVTQIPHGSSFGCTSCHVDASGGGVFTGFGSDATLYLVGDGHISERDLDWAPMASLDSDRDGFTNGEELGDPSGSWSIGDPDPSGRFYNPGDPNDHPVGTCGDGRVTPPEDCDGTNLGTLSCIGLGLDDGVLTCRSDCTFDRSGCGGSDAGTTSAPDAGAPDQPGDTDGDTACSVALSVRPTSIVGLLLMVFAAMIARRRKQ
jgi:hypothetical protein